MTIRSLAEAGAHLEKAYRDLPGEPADAEDAYARYESIAVAILDASAASSGPCSSADFIPGELQGYLETKLYEFRLIHHLVPFPDPREE
jgi:hypothetical protein